ncbi:restriction endonuclease subunit S [Proteiniphilum sp. UBA5510]|uniref:restriction endonuclease subunit S n=1 Tax=Proteiniphilum sp. UBA5510 TaxID=1947286 RepID=UPI00257B9B57|nr:restriction endonuclease subunit S [Proteiniphilum sp. UBA5510]
MSRIEQLIAELCPDGVEFKELGEVCEFQRGQIITKKNTIEGDIPVIAGGQNPAYYHNSSNRTGQTIAVSGSGAYAGFVSFWEIPIFLSDAFSVNPLKELLLTKYVYHFLKHNQVKIYGTQKGSGVPHVHGSSIAKFPIPIPPLPIQQEIARILDTFTYLDAELQAELEARKKQYEHYRNQLLNFEGKEVEWKTLGEVGKVCMCKRVMKHETNSSGEIPFYKIGTFGKEANAYISRELYDEYKKKFSFPSKGDILISASGTIGRRVIYDDKPAYFQDSNIIWLSLTNNMLLNKYLYYIYETIEWPVEGGTIKRLYNDNFKKIKIPIPPLAEQERLVSILDKFEALVNEELPSEIAARRKQYEYYRVKLLTFEPLVS